MPQQTPRTRSQLLPAVLIAIGLTLTVMIPKALFNALPTDSVTTPTSTAHTLELVGDNNVEFTPPAGWKRAKKDSDNDVEFINPTDDITVHVWAGNNVQNFNNSAKRLVMQRYRQGLAVAYEKATTRNDHGFTGRSCDVINIRQQTSGSCAVIGNNDVIVLVYALTKTRDDNPQHAGKKIVDDIVASLRLKKSSSDNDALATDQEVTR